MDKNQIINGALLRLRNNVSYDQMSPHDKTKSDIEREYTICLNKILCEHRWSFAKKSAILQEIHDELGGYEFPNDFVQMLGVGKDSRHLSKNFWEENGRFYVEGESTYFASHDYIYGICGACNEKSLCCTTNKCTNTKCEKYVCKPRSQCLLYYISNTSLFASQSYKTSGSFHSALICLLTAHLYDYYHNLNQKSEFLQEYFRDLAKAIALDNKNSRGDYRSATKMYTPQDIWGNNPFGSSRLNINRLGGLRGW